MKRYRVGIDLGGTNMAAGLVDEQSAIVCSHSIRTRQGATPEQLAEDMTGLVSLLCEKAGITKEEVISAGIGIPGSVSADGIVEDANNIGFYQVPFGQMMQERLQLPVTTVNDARAAALGEYYAGAGKGSHVFQMVTIGTGIGGALIIDGVAVAGCNGAAGEVGHMVIARGGAPCSCGRNGCYEAYASASALKRRMVPAVKETPTGLLYRLCGGHTELLSGKMLFEAVKQGDAQAQTLLQEHIEYLAEGIANLINMLQPDILCVGGGMSEQGEALLTPLRQAVSKKLYSQHSKVQTALVAAKLGNAAGIIGAVYA